MNYGLALVIIFWIGFFTVIFVGAYESECRRYIMFQERNNENEERTRKEKVYLNDLFRRTVAPLKIVNGTSRSCVNSWDDLEETATKAAYQEMCRLQEMCGYTNANSMTKASYDLASVLRECNRGQSVAAARAYARQLLKAYIDFLKDSAE